MSSSQSHSNLEVLGLTKTKDKSSKKLWSDERDFEEEAREALQQQRQQERKAIAFLVTSATPAATESTKNHLLWFNRPDTHRGRNWTYFRTTQVDFGAANAHRTLLDQAEKIRQHFPQAHCFDTRTLNIYAFSKNHYGLLSFLRVGPPSREYFGMMLTAHNLPLNWENVYWNKFREMNESLPENSEGITREMMKGVSQAMCVDIYQHMNPAIRSNYFSPNRFEILGNMVN